MSEVALELIVTVKTGETKRFSKSCGKNNSTVSLNNLHKNCVELQNEVNGYLTTLVEEERSVTNVNNGSKTNESDVDEDMSDDDEDEDSVEPNGPHAKRLKQ
ncbi:uncharacterized protein LOC133183453 [Saccostrea echinata]|uniref:uncharacterized protein LOC133183453 n=1 Tax=Saccostrea echinata TaxID=191078 RepID=UPI002A83CD08|nr:uncharacterized protein LOC133183453 [Saccostrea echinata]